MEEEYYLNEHDQNVKGGNLWWIVLLVFVISIAVFAKNSDSKLNEQKVKVSERVVNEYER